ncbi:lysophospholipid acyltransferase family protein [Caulobacter mirabilis]|uniref:1-acyl-sn-glycerol-3-phosphate acyltransferase n=1 Tax=Caulobacter mirabilis TaxID=69666 RepID=A0A2D2B230_9CAUL|nr:lysophospholipid acyltransferase family protein [Caulobacter mirabilis]ATQ44294.1 1-acyl-sn-glycerol-3-phosphate acyltransferase [Caulobacter mirabilis]
MAWLRWLLILLIARPVAKFMTGADVTGEEHLPVRGPAIIVANHNSHMDTLLMLSIFPARIVGKVRPAAASDYFLKDPVVGWFSRNLVGIVPVARDRVASGEDILAPAKQALADGDIIIVFPEGTRGDASDEIARLKSGVARLAEAFPDAPVTPVWIQGAGRVLPKGEAIPVPMNCAVLIGEPIRWGGRRTEFMDGLREALLRLKAEAPPLRWQ